MEDNYNEKSGRTGQVSCRMINDMYFIMALSIIFVICIPCNTNAQIFKGHLLPFSKMRVGGSAKKGSNGPIAPSRCGATQSAKPITWPRNHSHINYPSVDSAHLAAFHLCWWTLETTGSWLVLLIPGLYPLGNEASWHQSLIWFQARVSRSLKFDCQLCSFTMDLIGINLTLMLPSWL